MALGVGLLLVVADVVAGVEAERSRVVGPNLAFFAPHNGEHFLNISTSEGAPKLRCFAHLDFEMGFRHLSATAPCILSTSQLPKVFRHRSILYILSSACASHQNSLHSANS